MKEKYKINSLISGNIYSISPNDRGITSFETEERFLFERVTMPVLKKVSYRELFTGAKIKLNSDNYGDNSYSANFDTWYITDPMDLKDYITDDELKTGFITRFRLLEIYNEMNFMLSSERLQKSIRRIK